MLVATFVMAFSSCQKQEVEKVVLNECKGLLFSSEKPVFLDETKTEWTGETIQWSSNDAIRIAYTCDGVWQNADGTAAEDEESGLKTAKLYASTQLTEASATAQFSVPGNFTGNAEGEYVFYGVYPSVACVTESDFKYAPSVTVSIPAEQTPLVSTFDPKADLMAAKSPQAYTGIPEDPEDPISLLWTRIVAHGHLTLKGLETVGEEKISTITLTADSEADMVGQHYLYLDTYNVVKPNSNNTANVLTINADNLSIDDGNVTFWACFLPCVVKSLKVEVETNMATYTRIIEACSLDFKQNARNILSINMASAERVEKEEDTSDYSGIYAILTKRSSGDYYYMTNDLGSASTKRFTAESAGASLPESGIELGSSKLWEVSKTDDYYVVRSVGSDKYITWTSGNSANLGDEGILFTITQTGDGLYNLMYKATDEDRYLSLNNTSGNNYFALYKSGQAMNLALIPAVQGEDPSVLTATAPGQMSAAGGEGSFTFTLTNPKDGQSVTATEELDWISDVSVAGNTVSYTVAENTSSESREGTITLKYEGVEDVEVTVTQAGYVDPEAGGNLKTFTVKSDDIVNNSSYKAYSYTIDNRGWVITFGGNNKSVGTNSTNRSNCKLASYSKYAVTPITTTSIASAFASTTSISNVTKISYAGLSGGSNHASTKVYVLYSEDGATFSQINLTNGTQGEVIDVANGGEFEFDARSGYFAVVFVATNASGNWRLDDVNLTFTYSE